MISLYDILEAADGQLFGEPATQIFTDFCFDSREVNPGELYVAMKTDRGDGHHFMEDAVSKGASGIMCTDPPSFDTDGLTVIVMRNIEDALMRWTQIVLEKFGTTVIGVTGSVGKSVTVEAIAHVLRSHFTVYTNPRSFNGRFGLPLALGKLSKDDRIAVLEFSTNQPGEMAEMVAVTKPVVGVVTAIGHAHTDRLGSLETIAQEKSELVRRLPATGLAVLNFDDPLVRSMATEIEVPVLTVGLDVSEPSFGADLLAYNLLVDRYKTGFDLRYGAERYPGRWVPLLGAHQLYSVLTALAVGISYDISLEEGLQALTEFEPLPGRMRAFGGLNGSLLIDDTCSASPEGVLAALDWLRIVRAEQGRAIFVMGDITELGSYSTRAHIQTGQHAAGIVDHLVTHGDLAAESGRAALEQGMRRSEVAITFSTEDAALATSINLDAHDIVLVKGGSTARMERVVRRLLADQADINYLARETGEHQQILIKQPEHPTWVQIDLEALAYNVRRLKEMVGPEVTLLAVVKANAYGHGAIPVSTTALNHGAEYLGVASLHEALELRRAGINAPILIMGYVLPRNASQVLYHDLTITLHDLEMARIFNRAAREANTTLRAHVQVDTGTGLLGLLPDEVTLFFRSVRNLEHLHIEGIYTQFSAADADIEYTHAQIEVFEQVVDPLLAARFQFDYIHAANSAAVTHLPESRFSMVRTGIAMYGLSSSVYTPVPADFKPVLEWKTMVIQSKRLPRGSFIGDGNTYRTQSVQHIALIPVGYADGFRRAPMRWKQVLIKGEYAPLIGQVSMNLAAIDVTRIEDVKIGEEVVLIGQQGHRQITVDDVSEYLSTNNYEVISTLLAKMPRMK